MSTGSIKCVTTNVETHACKASLSHGTPRDIFDKRLIDVSNLIGYILPFFVEIAGTSKRTLQRIVGSLLRLRTLAAAPSTGRL